MNSLRNIINTLPSGFTVTFDPSLAGQKIVLTSGQIIVSNSITIDASTLTNGVTISGNNSGRILTINSGANVSLVDLTFTGGNTKGGATNGGAILNNGSATIVGCTFATNGAGSGGAILNNNSATMTVADCTFAGNSCLPGGGGGAINNESLMTVYNCTIANNFGGFGGGIYNAGTLNLTNAIACLNTAAVLSANIYGSFNGSSNLVDVANPQLVPLGSYGGLTQTMPPIYGSPAIDAGNDTVTSLLIADQRGIPRRSLAHVDIGAVEIDSNSIVTVTADFGIGSLRNAIARVLPGDIVYFAPGLSGQTIGLAGSQLVLSNNITIDGTSVAPPLRISGNHAHRIFGINPGITANLNGLVLTNGFDQFGGCIFNGNGAILTINQCTLAGNGTTGISGIDGGAILNNGTVNLNNSTFAGNVGLYGGVVYNNLSCILNINDCTLAANVATNGGGAIYNYGGTVTINQATIAGNASPANGAAGGGIFGYGGGTLNITNTIVCLNTAPSSPNLYFSFGSTVNNAGNLVDNANPLLASLGNYGGPTQTMPPLPGSPAIDAGAPSPLATDQRGAGYPRVMNLFADVGAVEALEPSIPNAGFEVDQYANGVGYASQNGGGITGWTISNTNFIGLNPAGGSPFADNGAIPQGANVAFIQSQGQSNSLATVISGLIPGGSYVVTFRADCRGSYGNFPGASWSVNDGAFVPFTASPPVGGSNPYYTNSAVFTASGTTAALVVANAVAGDSTVVIDDFSVATNQPASTTTPFRLTGVTRLGNGSVAFAFTNATGVSFTVFASTNVATPFGSWANLGPAVETPTGSGNFQFTDPVATNYPVRFYRVRSP
jgi:hypothetical protein